MQNDQIDIEALKNNKDFLANLTLFEEEMREEKSIAKAYQLLDTLLLVSEDEEKINEIFSFILGEAFEMLAEKLSNQEGFDLSKSEELFTARAIYEHAIERYSENDLKGAKELFEILYHMADDERLKEAMLVHAVCVMQGKDFDTFIAQIADTSRYDETERLAYFILYFQIEIKAFLGEQEAFVAQVHNDLKVFDEEKES